MNRSFYRERHYAFGQRILTLRTQLGLTQTGLAERLHISRRAVTEWEAGKAYMGGIQRNAPDMTTQKILRAIDIKTGNIAWELPQVGPANSWGGTLASASGLVFFAEDSGMLMAVDGSNGKPLWQFQTNQLWKASPMTYMFDGKQYIAIAAGQSIIAFGLTE